jgi:uncharacterized protein YdiU (UPF0061 family)
MRRKVGLFNEEPEDLSLIESLLGWMQTAKADFTNTFAGLSPTAPPPDAPRRHPELASWHERWRSRLERQAQSLAESEQLRRTHNPTFIPRNHLVEAALAAAEQGDLGPMEKLLEVLSAPYDSLREAPDYRQPAPESGTCYQTFCGT